MESMNVGVVTMSDWEYATALKAGDGSIWDCYPVSPRIGESDLQAAVRDAQSWNDDGDNGDQTCVVVRRTPAVPAGEWAEVVAARENAHPEEGP
jgi:hypothetical protein